MLEDYLVLNDPANPPNTNPNYYTPSAVFARKKNIVAILSPNSHTTLTNYFWPSSNYVDSSYDEFQSAVLPFPDEKVAWLKNRIPAWLKGTITTPGAVGNFFNDAAIYIWTLTNLEDNRRYINPNIVDWLEGWIQDPLVRRNLNLVSLDACDKPDNLIKGLIHLNRTETLSPIYQWHREGNGLEFYYTQSPRELNADEYSTFDGPQFFISPALAPGTVPVYLMTASDPNRMCYSLSNTPAPGWTSKGIAFYAYIIWMIVETQPIIAFFPAV
jgi:hypothetical protein